MTISAPNLQPARRAYRAGEAAAILGMSRVTLWRRMKDGTIRTVLVGGVRLVPADSIEQLLSPAQPQ